MSIKILSGERYNILATGESVSVSPSANSLFPAANIHDGRPDAACRFSAASTDATITVDGSLLRNGTFDSFSGNPTSWTVTGAVAETTDAVSGSAARIDSGGAVFQDVEVRSGQRIVLDGYARDDGAVGGFFGAVIQNLETGKFYNSTAWTATPSQVFSGAASSYGQAGPLAFEVEDFATVGKDRCTLRLTLRNSDVVAGAYVYVDSWALWQAVDFASIHGHNIRADVAARLESSPDNFATSSSGSTVLQATMTKAQPAFYTSLSSAVDDRYWRLRLLYTSLSTSLGVAPTESVWIGEAVIGQATELTRPQDLGQEIRLAADNVRLSTPFGGTRVHRFGEQPRRILGMSFNFFTSSEYQEARQEVFERSFGSANPIVIVPDSDQPEVLHGRIDDTWAVRQTLDAHFTENDLVVVEDAFPVWTP